MADEHIRLHITPFTSTLLPTILPPSTLANARNISYHNLQTFPDRPYGYVELPTMDAERIKKKLNGTILKGTKVKIDTARPQIEIAGQESEAEKSGKRKKEKGKKRKRDEIPAVDIGERSVKRGWTTPGAMISKSNDTEKKTPVKSKYTTGPECLFKTVLPPNVASHTPAKDSTSKRSRGDKEATIHEFSKTTKYATFLRSGGATSGKKSVAGFVESKGWVDEDGNLIEEVKAPRRTSEKNILRKAVEKVNVSVDDSSSDGSSSTGEVSVADKVKPKTSASTIERQSDQSSDDSASEGSTSVDGTEAVKVVDALSATAVDEERSNSDNSLTDGGSAEASAEALAEQARVSKYVQTSQLSPHSSNSPPSSDEESTSEDISISKSHEAHESSASSSDSSSGEDSSSVSSESEDEHTAMKASRPDSSSGPPPGLSITIPSSASTPVAAVHPLEALYKRPKADSMNQVSKPMDSSFSFFGADVDEDLEEEESHDQVPLTPFTQKDFEYRGIRSAAPTPDTAHANKRFIWPNENDDDHEEAASSPIRKGKATTRNEEAKGTSGETEFQQWFYEHRGETNRAWKKRRKTVAKEKRQRENRKRQERF